MKTHPNATVSFISAAGVGSILFWALGKTGVHMTTTDEAKVVGALPLIALFIGRRGIKGAASAVWNGTQQAWSGSPEAAAKKP